MVQHNPTADASGRELPVSCDILQRGPQPKVRLAYLISRYPAVTHTFIYREAAMLRKLGAVVEISSINAPDRPLRDLPDGERAEAEKVFYVKAAARQLFAAATLRTARRHFTGMFRGMGLALSVSGFNPKSIFKWVGYYAEALIVGDWLERNDFRHLHVHFATEVANVALLTANIFQVELSMTVHGPDEFYDVTLYALTQKLETATLVCCIGNFTRSQLMKLVAPAHWGKFQVARLGVDLDAFEPRGFRAEPDVFELLCVGRLTPAKGQHILLGAMKRILSKGHRARLRLVGDGPDRGLLESYCKANGLENFVAFEGAVQQDVVKTYLEECDVFVLASFAEGIPVALMEAMAREIPCVATTITGIPELIRHGQDGLLVSPSDDEALADAIMSLIDDPDYRLRLGVAGRRRVASEYQLERNVTRLRDLFFDRIKACRA